MVNEGMPFGAVLSGLQIFQPSYLWSLEFWSSISSKRYQAKKKLSFAILVLICILVIILAGPSSANLLIARHGMWTTKPAYIAFGATPQNIWPDRLEGNDIPRKCAVVKYSALFSGPDPDPDCPLFSSLVLIDPLSLQALNTEVPAMTTAFSMSNTTVGYSKELTTTHCVSLTKAHICATTPQEVVLGGLATDSENQLHLIKNNLDAYQRIQEEVFQPYTVANCVTKVNTNFFDLTPLRFPRIFESISELSHDRDLVAVSGIAKRQAMQTSGNLSQYLVNWVDLPQNLSNGIPGVAVIHPHHPGSSLFNITTCTLAAGWGTSAIWTHLRDYSSMYSRIINVPSSWQIVTTTNDPYGYAEASRPDFGRMSNFSCPQRHINISKK